MTMQFERRVGQPVSLGKRVGARLIMAGIAGIPALIMNLKMGEVMASTLYGIPLSGGTSFLFYGSMLLSLGIAVWGLVLIFKESTTIGGKLLGFQFVVAPSGEDAKVKVFLKYLLQGLLEGVTFGLAAISYLVTYRDGQHWLDRALGVVAVDKASIARASSARSPIAAAPQPAGGAVTPVSMPQAPRPQPQPTENTSAAPPDSLRSFRIPTNAPATPADTADSAPPAGFGGASGFVATPPTPIRPVSATPEPPVKEPPAAFAPPNPWARTQDNSPAPIATPFGASPAPSSPPFSPSSPFSGAPVSAQPVPPLGAPQVAPEASPFGASAQPSLSLLDDRTVVDIEEDEAVVVVLDDGQEVRVDAPLVLGRNPSAPAEYPQARPVQLIDESMRLSKTHVVLLPFGGGLAFYDVGATNGVSIELDGSKAKVTAKEVHELPAGAVLHVGGRHLQVRQ